MTIKIGKVILSRKGFDSGEKAGGDYSRVDPVTRRYILIPIPETEDSSKIYKYEDLRVAPNYLSDINAHNLKDLILNPKLGMNKKARDSANGYAHFDPWLGPCPWMDKNDPLNPSIGAFGQQDAPLGHLSKQDVLKDIDEGRLFLFFSRFKRLDKNATNPLKIHPNGSYFIYGWLKVDEIIDDINKLDINVEKELRIKKHPHLYSPKTEKNKIFLGAKWLDEEKTIRGYGYFRELDEKLRLSKLGDNPNIWELPEFFYRGNPKELLSRLKSKKWSISNNRAIMDQLKGNGQEFVFNASLAQEKFNEWLINDLVPLMQKEIGI